MDSSPLTREDIDKLRPTFQSRFQSRLHRKAEDVGRSLVAFMDNHLDWSPEARESFIRSQMHLTVPHFVPDAEDELVEAASIWFTVWHWLDDTLEQCTLESQSLIRLLPLIQGLGRPEEGNHLEVTVYEIHDHCRRIGASDARLLFSEITNLTMVWFEAVLSHRSQAPKTYTTMEEWLKFRKTEIAAHVMWPFIRWVMVLHIPPEIVCGQEIERLEELAGTHAVYINDLWSLRKELLDMQRKANVGIKIQCPNTVLFYASRSRISLANAVKSLEEELAAYEKQYLEAEKTAIEAISAEYGDEKAIIVAKYAHALKTFMAGNTTWSSQCRRYNDLDMCMPLHYRKSDVEVMGGL